MPDRDERLQEPGAGWRNDLIELGHARESYEPEKLASYRADPTDATRAWLTALKAEREHPPEPCWTCPAMTSRRVVGMVEGTEVREHAILWVHPQCERCAKVRELAQYRAIAAKPNAQDDQANGVRMDLWEGAHAEIARLEQELAIDAAA
jgi:hypothetical protein